KGRTGRSTRRPTSRCARFSSRSRPRTPRKASRRSSPSASRTSRGSRMDLGIRGKIALVTGAARSLGKADAVALAAEGCAIAILDLDGDGAAGAAGEIEASGGRARGYACDIRESAQIQDVVRRVERDLGPVDICVNNAGLIYTVEIGKAAWREKGKVWRSGGSK